ncbi:MAG TPA: hypothetical protein VH234_05170 [Candidatus Saccharimonadales bacterium]|jgi:hypothetical protein|nr:hypothetical protein [Candidatus Saccharimonadales bacterium]
MKHQSNNLRQELKLAGATDSEIKGLLPLATNLKQLKNSSGSLSKYQSRRQYQSRWKKLLPIGITSITGLALGMALVISSQTVLPGSMLYPVQKLSDNLSMSVDPDFRGTVMMKRAQEVKQLIAEHANSNLVLATLADYQTEASAYKSAPANYAVFEYCKTNLQQAANMAPSSEREVINNTLISLSNV